MLIDVMMWSPLVLIPVQIALCMKCRRLIWKLIPVILFAVAMAGNFIASYFTDGWAGIGYFVVAVFHVYPLGGCVIGWLITFCINLYFRLKKKASTSTDT